jgi:cell division protein FtsQ
VSTTQEDSAPAADGAEGAADPAAARRADPWKAAFVILLIAAVLAVVAWVLLGSRLLVVRDIEVTGTDRVDRAAVADATGVTTGTPLARVDTEAAARGVRGLDLVESVRVTRAWPAALRVEVTERAPLLSVRAGDGYLLVDGDGVRVDGTATRPEDHPLVAVRGEVEGSPAVAAAAAVVGDLPDDLRSRVTEIRADEPAAIELVLADGATAAWGDTERGAEKAEILRLLIAEHPPEEGREYDVSAVGTAVVR